MDDHQPLEFTCKTCGGHKLTVTRVWKILAGPDSESWQEWGRDVWLNRVCRNIQRSCRVYPRRQVGGLGRDQLRRPLRAG
jgi:hypothetical protein